MTVVKYVLGWRGGFHCETGNEIDSDSFIYVSFHLNCDRLEKIK